MAWALLVSFLLGQHPRGPLPREDFAHLAEGLTASTEDDAIEAGYRMFSAPDFVAICTQAHADSVKRLRSLSGRVRLRVERQFDPSSLKVVALDASGSVVPKVPVAIEI